METSVILNLVKENLNIKTDVRDGFLTSIINGVLTELQDEKGITLDSTNMNHVMFVVDYSAYRYRSRGENGAMPIDLRFRLNNLFIHNGGADEV